MDDSQEKNTIAMPAPSAWPLITAFGVALAFGGLLTHPAISVIGLVVLARAGIGWWRDVLPHEKHEEVPITTVERAVQVSAAAVYHLAAGADGHRVRIPTEIHPYSSGLRGGVAGGIAMALVAAVFGLISEGSLWYPVNLFAAGLVPSLAEASPAVLHQFSAIGMAVGVAVHGVVSLLVGVLYAVLLPMFPRRVGLWSGLVTPVVWSGLIAATLDIINPTMNARINWLWFVASQIAFGLTAAYVVARTQKIETMQSWPLMQRAGIESPEPDEENPRL